MYQAQNLVTATLKSKALFSNLALLWGIGDDLQFCWLPPLVGSIKINVDASVKACGSLAGVGGVARNHDGNFVFGFAKKVHQCSVIEAELLAVFHGVSMAMDKRCFKVVVETDSQGALDLLIGGSNAIQSLSSIIDSTLNAVNSTCEVSWAKVLREFNKVADSLAKFSLILDCNFVYYDATPHSIDSLLLEDKMRMPSLLFACSLGCFPLFLNIKKIIHAAWFNT